MKERYKNFIGHPITVFILLIIICWIIYPIVLKYYSKPIITTQDTSSIWHVRFVGNDTLIEGDRDKIIKDLIRMEWREELIVQAQDGILSTITTDGKIDSINFRHKVYQYLMFRDSLAKNFGKIYNNNQLRQFNKLKK